MPKFYTKSRAAVCGIVALLLCLSKLPSHASEPPVAIEIVLALDASASMNSQEFDLQIFGIAEAFRDPQVQHAIEKFAPQGIAIAILQWGGPDESAIAMPFRRLVSIQDCVALAADVGKITRQISASTTSISTAITHSLAALQDNEFFSQRLVIDVSGDGRDTEFQMLEAARARAKQAGVTVNGLAIESEDGALAEYYGTHVRTGAFSFVMRAVDFKDYVRAIREKLIEELRPLGS